MYVIERVSYDHSPPLCVTDSLAEAKAIVKLLGGATYYEVPQYNKGYIPRVIPIYRIGNTYMVPEKEWYRNEICTNSSEWEFDITYGDKLGGHWSFNWDKTYGFLDVWGIDKDEVDKFFIKAKAYLTLHPDTPARPLHNFKKLKEFNG